MPKSINSWLALILILALVVVVALTIAPPSHSYVGKITDSMCATADHDQVRKGPTDAACTVACVRLGASYVLYDGKATYLLGDQMAPEAYAGKRVRVIGTLDPQTKTIQVASITEKNVDNLAVAYLALALVLFGYLFSLSRRTAQVEDEVARLSKKM